MIGIDYIPGNSTKRLQELSAAVGISARDMAWEEMRLSVNSAIKFTYPNKKSDGTKAINRDLAKVFWPSNGKQSSTSDIIASTFKSGDKYTGIKTQSGAVVFTETSKFLKGKSASNSTLEKIHQSARNKRTGRVKGGKSTKDGNRVVIGRTMVQGSRFRSYAASVRKRSGQQKAGWLPAGDHFSMRSKSGMAKAPAWVRKQPKQMGSYKDLISKGGNGFLSASNKTGYWSSKKRVALENVVHGIAQKRLRRVSKKRMEDLQTRFNSGKRMAA